jgi:DNA-binding SARP family transcriptional activator
MLVLVGEQPFPHLRSRKALWMLALLASRSNRPVSREWLATILWPDAQLNLAFANLRPVVSELRHALGAERERLRSLDRNTISLDLNDADVDLLQFDSAILNRNFDLAASLYRGPLLEGCPEEWVPQERMARERECVRALEILGESALKDGNYEGAGAHFARLVKLDSSCDSGYRGLMESLAAKGDLNSALQTYRKFAHLLMSEAGCAPDPQTTDLYDRLRVQARAGVAAAHQKRSAEHREALGNTALTVVKGSQNIADKLRYIASLLDDAKPTEGQSVTTVELKLQFSISPRYLAEAL